jgi:hypothetical protein
MTLSINAWLQHKNDQYKYSIRDITVGDYLTQARLNRPECTHGELRKFNDPALSGEWNKATRLQSDFVKHASWIM